MAVSRGVSQPERVSEEPPDLFSEEEASNTTTKSNGVHSDDDNDLFAGEKTFFFFFSPLFSDSKKNPESCEIYFKPGSCKTILT